MYLYVHMYLLVGRHLIIKILCLSLFISDAPQALKLPLLYVDVHTEQTQNGVRAQNIAMIGKKAMSHH